MDDFLIVEKKLVAEVANTCITPHNNDIKIGQSVRRLNFQGTEKFDLLPWTQTTKWQGNHKTMLSITKDGSGQHSCAELQRQKNQKGKATEHADQIREAFSMAGYLSPAKLTKKNNTWGELETMQKKMIPHDKKYMGKVLQPSLCPADFEEGR